MLWHLTRTIQWNILRSNARNLKRTCFLVRFYTHLCVNTFTGTDKQLDGYGIYRENNFPYDITLARSNLRTNQNERYALKVRFANHRNHHLSVLPLLSYNFLP